MGRIIQLTIKRSKLLIKAFVPYPATDIIGFCLSYKHKNESDKVEHLIPVEKIIPMGSHECIVKGSVDLSIFPFRQTHWLLTVATETEGIKYRVILKQGKRSRIEKFFQFLASPRFLTSNGKIVFPYYTAGKVAGLTYREKSKYDRFGIRLKECIAVLWYKLFKQYYRSKNIYLLYEKKCMKAQDNAYYLFLNAMQEKAENTNLKSVYFVLDVDSPDQEKVRANKNNILDFMSFRHMVYLLASRALISPDSRPHAYIWQKNGSIIAPVVEKKRHVFLGHGVLAFKRLNDSFARKNMKSSLVIVTSEAESKIVQDYLGYDSSEISDTGYARFDALENQSTTARGFLVMPTFRREIFGIEREIFRESNFYSTYASLLTSKRLRGFLEDQDMKLHFYLHPSVREHLSLFSQLSSERVHIISYDEEPLDFYLMSCKALVTDYSSVAWDVLYLKKPVLFYQFDVEDYLDSWGSYLDFKKDLPGPAFSEEADLINSLVELEESDFSISGDEEKHLNTYFTHMDRNNCNRIWDAIEARKL